MLNICCVCTVRKGCLERQLFLEGTAQRLQTTEELLVPSHVVQSAGGEALVQNTDELVKVPRVHDTAPQPSRGDRQDDSSDLLVQAVFCLNRWVLCIPIVEERRLVAALHMEAKFLEQLPVVELRQSIVQVTEACRALAIEPQFHGFVRACSVCFGSLNKCSTKRLTASIITRSCHSSLFVSILPTNSKTSCKRAWCGVLPRSRFLSRTSSVSSESWRGFDLRWSLCRFGRAFPKHTRHMIQRLVHADTRRRIHRMILNHRNAPTFGIFRRTASPKVGCTSRRPSFLAKSLYGTFASAGDTSFKVCASKTKALLSCSQVSP